MSNTGLIRQLKSLNKNNKELSDSNNSKRSIRKPYFWSFVAIVISLISLYFQFFYINYDLRLNLVDAYNRNDSLRYQIIYHNRGNQDATILNSKIDLFPKNRDKKNSIELTQRNIPLILSSGKQDYEEMKIAIDLNNYNLKSWGFKYSDTLSVELSFEFFNDNNYRSEQRFICGWIKLDSLQQIEYHLTDLKSVDLESDRVFTRSYRTE